MAAALPCKTAVAGQNTFGPFAAILRSSQYALPIERAIIATVAFNAGGIVGGLLLGRLVDEGRPYGVLTLAYACAAVLVAAVGTIESGSVFVLMSAIVVAGFFVIGTQFCMNALAATFYPTGLRSTGVGWAQGIGRIGSIVGPVIGGLLLSFGWSSRTLFMAIAAPAAVSSLAVFLLGRGQQQIISRRLLRAAAHSTSSS